MNNLTLNETRENLNYSDTIVLTSTLYNDSPE